MDTFFTLGWLDEMVGAFEELSKNTHYSYSQNFPPMNSLLDEDTGVLSLEFALSGYDPKEIDLVFSGDSLRLVGKKAAVDEDAKRKVIKRGIRNRDFEAKYQLPTGKFDTANATAAYKNGILKLSIPPTVNQERKKVKIEF